MSEVRFVGNMTEWACPMCSSLMTGLRVPPVDERSCANCTPVPPPTSSVRDVAPHDQIAFWLERARLYVDAKQWDMALVALSNVAAFIERDHPIATREIVARLAGKVA